VFAANSDGLVPVISKAAPLLPHAPILSVTKGFLASKTGEMARIDVVAAETAGRAIRFVHAGGPAKAMEIARGVLTLMEFASKDREDATRCARAFGAPHMHIGTTDDIAGAEICSALKNAYATGLGLWDGFVGKDAHNARAACFAQAIAEMRRLVIAGGGRAETVHGAAGVGDLHVTAAGGRNRVFGERVGTGRKAADVAREMLAAGELTEGYPAIASARRFAEERGVRDVPLLEAIFAIVWKDADVGATLGALRLDA
jgi:glycerol-3-phosphate dehydrogenase (NAD(P)+)